FALLNAYIEADDAAPVAASPELVRARMLRSSHDFDFLRGDIGDLLKESGEGLVRVKGIVQDLKDFSRTGGEEAWEMADLHAVLESTLNIVKSELKRKARIEINYGDLPKVECVPSRLGQVFINLLVNAGQALGAAGKVTLSTGVEASHVWPRAADATTPLSTGVEASHVWIRVQDTGSGISAENLSRIFDPFFTTKPVG